MSHTISIRLGTAIAVLSLGACGDSATPTRPAVTTSGGAPQFTLGSGITTTTLVRANAGPFHIQSKYEGFNVELKTHDDADVVVASLSAAPGGNSGWHSHPGPIFVSVKSGALTTYDADDPECRGRTYVAGTVFIETGGHTHYARNETSGTTEWVSTYIVKKGGATRVEEPAPGNCPF